MRFGRTAAKPKNATYACRSCSTGRAFNGDVMEAQTADGAEKKASPARRDGAAPLEYIVGNRGFDFHSLRQCLCCCTLHTTRYRAQIDWYGSITCTVVRMGDSSQRISLRERVGTGNRSLVAAVAAMERQIGSPVSRQDIAKSRRRFDPPSRTVVCGAS